MKRFTETDKWRDPWYRKLPFGTKLAHAYLWDNCDKAGVWTPDFEQANFSIGYKVEWEEVRKSLGDRLMTLSNGDWLLVDFVDFQYRELKWTCAPHKPIIQLVRKHMARGYPLDVAQIAGDVPFEDMMGAEPQEPTNGAAYVPAAATRRTVPKKTGPGTLEEILAFCTEAGIDAKDGEWFFHKCEGAGWMNAGRPIIDWKATLRSWRASSILPSQKDAKAKENEKARRSNFGSNSGSRGATGHTQPTYRVPVKKAENGAQGS